MPKVHYVKRESLKKKNNPNPLLMLAESSSEAVEMEADTVIQNIAPTSSQLPNASFKWNIHADRVLIDYCSYFLNSDGSIGDEKWAPLAQELGTSAASCRMRWHVIKGSASQATWEQQQQYLRQKLRPSVHQNQTATRTLQTLHSSSTAASTHHQHHRGEVDYFNPEFDAYLQRVLWEDDDFVRAVDAIHREEKGFNLASPVRVEI